MRITPSYGPFLSNGKRPKFSIWVSTAWGVVRSVFLAFYTSVPCVFLSIYVSGARSTRSAVPPMDTLRNMRFSKYAFRSSSSKDRLNPLVARVPLHGSKEAVA